MAVEHKIYRVPVLIIENLNWENDLLQKSTDFLPWVIIHETTTQYIHYKLVISNRLFIAGSKLAVARMPHSFHFIGSTNSKCICVPFVFNLSSVCVCTERDS